ncbi:MAG: DUF1553 domain-containing protein, partial [Akkermansiaceae bacterium]|nr:DUF1553 domain-containing protein [Akkermansiaceae bacterium]
VPASIVQADADKAKLRIVTSAGHAEYRADPNAAGGAVYRLTLTAPAAMSKLTALRLEFLPENEEAARHTPEWGAILKRFQLQVSDGNGKPKPVAIAEIIADEAHPLFDPNGSIKGSDRGWGTYSKTFGPRHCTIVLAEALPLSPDTRLLATLTNGPSIIASFPMTSKRGRLFLTDDDAWTRHISDPATLERKKHLAAAREALKRIPSTRLPVMRERDPRHPRETRVFVRGNWLDKGELVSPGTPALFPPFDPKGEPPRLAMARWIASSENPLTARVAVNRFWLELFGTGIVPTPEDFGSAGEPPTHPELLDTLAFRFSGEMRWSMKSLLREIVTSATYRQSAKVSSDLAARDPGNRLLARGPRQRVTAEMARDATLAAAGLLSDKSGGPPVHPPLPDGVWKPFVAGDRWQTPEEGGEDRYRRSLYTYWKRSIPYPVFVAFDSPTRELCSKRRMVSNTPLQALFLLNDPAFSEAASALARRMNHETTGDLDAKLAAGYRATTSRTPTPDRLDELRKLHTEMKARYTSEPDLMREIADNPDDAAFTVVASVLLNLDEAVCR